VLRDILALAREQRLATYDASYLELAVRRRLPLATRDTALQKAADRLGLGLLAV
jgi:predicted nucleic acid-binding protein